MKTPRDFAMSIWGHITVDEAGTTGAEEKILRLVTMLIVNCFVGSPLWLAVMRTLAERNGQRILDVNVPGDAIPRWRCG